MPNPLIRHGFAALLCIGLLVTMSGCEEPSRIDVPSTTNDISNHVAANSDCGAVKYGRPRILARLADDRITESSGLARSLVHKHRFWTHNDGNSPRLYAIDMHGETVAVVKLAGAKFVDCEDKLRLTRRKKLAAVCRHRRQRSYAERVSVAPRRRTAGKRRPQEATRSGRCMSIPFRYPDGPHNCEAAAIDPKTFTVYLATKEPSRGTKVYELELPAALPAKPLVRGLSRYWILDARPRWTSLQTECALSY